LQFGRISVACSYSLVNYSRHSSINSLAGIIRVFGEDMLEVVAEVVGNAMVAIVVELEWAEGLDNCILEEVSLKYNQKILLKLMRPIVWTQSRENEFAMGAIAGIRIIILTRNVSISLGSIVY
jgi:hypothetical protein